MYGSLAQVRCPDALAALFEQQRDALAAIWSDRGAAELLRRHEVPASLDGEALDVAVSDRRDVASGERLEVGHVAQLADALPFCGGVVRVSAVRALLKEVPAPGIISSAAKVDPPATEEIALFSPPPTSAPCLVLQSGERIPLDRGAVIGRMPSSDRRDGVRPPRLVSLGTLSSVVSRNHVRLELAAGGVTATDLGSTNGTTVTRPGSLTQRLRPGSPVPLAVGDIISLGDGVTLTLAH